MSKKRTKTLASNESMFSKMLDSKRVAAQAFLLTSRNVQYVLIKVVFESINVISGNKCTVFTLHKLQMIISKRILEQKSCHNGTNAGKVELNF